MPFLIDGYNLLRLIEKTGQVAQLTEIQLCRIVSDYLRYKGENGEVVFDGSGPREKGAFDAVPFLYTTFAGGGKDADTLIEKKILESTAPKRLIVISSDRRLRDAAQKRKAISVDSESFWKELEKVNAARKKRKKRSEPREKYEGISESETEYWLKVFGLK
jgi:predicted RNA-binding protein with PIN domain